LVRITQQLFWIRHSTDDEIIVLGASLYDVLTTIKARSHEYPLVDLYYSSPTPLLRPVIVSLTNNGIRLHFDGQDQRLRLIEVLDFTKIAVRYKEADLVKPVDDIVKPTQAHLRSTGPPFKQIYHKSFGITFEGEYLEPKDASSSYGTYVLSYPGVALSFLVKASAWTSSKDTLLTLSSSDTLPAKSLAIFDGLSWKEARTNLFTRSCTHPRSLSLGSRREGHPDEIEYMRILGHGHIEVLRRSSNPFHLLLNETTAQDLVAEFGPPDAIYRKNDRRLSIHKTYNKGWPRRGTSGSLARFDGAADPEAPTTAVVTDDSDVDDVPAVNKDGTSVEHFFNYFHHGFDVFLSYPSTPSPGLIPSSTGTSDPQPIRTSNRLVATKLLLHGNIPGSFPFNRYRRSRWSLEPGKQYQHLTKGRTLDSETLFKEISGFLGEAWKDDSLSQEQERSLRRAMVLNRGWGDSSSSSCELLGGWEDGPEGGDVGIGKRKKKVEVADKEAGLGNTELFGFPGLLFEVLKNDTVSCLTVY
jgi:hypothetical protein